MKGDILREANKEINNEQNVIKIELRKKEERMN
jgi:hypothetical protein